MLNTYVVLASVRHLDPEWELQAPTEIWLYVNVINVIHRAQDKRSNLVLDWTFDALLSIITLLRIYLITLQTYHTS